LAWMALGLRSQTPVVTCTELMGWVCVQLPICKIPCLNNNLYSTCALQKLGLIICASSLPMQNGCMGCYGVTVMGAAAKPLPSVLLPSSGNTATIMHTLQGPWLQAHSLCYSLASDCMVCHDPLVIHTTCCSCYK
jgi:hypothetical protein